MNRGLRHPPSDAKTSRSCDPFGAMPFHVETFSRTPQPRRLSNHPSARGGEVVDQRPAPRALPDGRYRPVKMLGAGFGVNRASATGGPPRCSSGDSSAIRSVCHVFRPFCRPSRQDSIGPGLQETPGGQDSRERDEIVRPCPSRVAGGSLCRMPTVHINRHSEGVSDLQIGLLPRAIRSEVVRALRRMTFEARRPIRADRPDIDGPSAE